MRNIILAAVAALAFASAADARHCRGPHKCRASAVSISGAFTGAHNGGSVCWRGKPCGNVCIPKGKVCHAR